MTPTRLRHLIQSASILMVAFFINKLIAIGRQIIVAPTFGTGAEFDAYVAAFRLPDILYMMISGGALATAFIPILSERLTQSPPSDPHGWQLVSGVLNNMLLAALLVSGLVAIFAKPIVAHIVAPGFDAETQLLTANMMRLLLVSTVIFSLSGLVGAVLNSHQHFVLPAIAPIIYNLGIIFGAIFLVPYFGIYGLVWGTIAGSIGHLLTQLPALIHYARTPLTAPSTHGQHLRQLYRATLGWHDPRLREIVRLMGPRILTMFVIQLNFVIMFRLASELGEGSVSALDYGWDLMQMPQTIIGTAIGIVLFPTMSELAARQNTAQLWQTTLQTMRIMLTLAMPALVGLIVLGRPVIQLLFERGEFDAHSTALVYQTLQFWSLALLAHCLMEAVNRFFYAQKDTLTPLISSVFSTLLNIGLAYSLYQTFQAGGLALSNGIAVSLEILLLLAIAQRRGHSSGFHGVLTLFGKSAIAAFIMGAVIMGFLQIELPLIITLGVSSLLGVVVYFVVGLALGIQEIQWLPNLIRQRGLKPPLKS